MPAPVKSQLAEEWSADPEAQTSKWPIRPYQRPPLTTDTTVKYAPLVEIDVSRFDEPGEKQRLADQLHHAVRDVGFYIVKGHAITDEEVLEILGIANTYFHNLSLEEKRRNPIDLGAGQSFGYREPTRYFGDTGIKETLETVYLVVQSHANCSMKSIRIASNIRNVRHIPSSVRIGIKSVPLVGRSTRTWLSDYSFYTPSSSSFQKITSLRCMTMINHRRTLFAG